MYLGPRVNSSASTVVCLLPEASGLQVTLDDGPIYVLLELLSTGEPLSSPNSPLFYPNI